MRESSYREALTEALRQEMRADPRVFVLGEDIRYLGGGFDVLKGLWEEFGDERVVETPISESAIAGAAVGAAILGMRPVAEIMFGDLLAIAMDQIVNGAAKVRYQHAGALGASLVIRSPLGAGLRYGMHHSQSIEAWFIHTPGLKVAMPSSPADAKGLLTAAIRDPDPVIVFEHKALYAAKGPVPEEPYAIPLGQAEIKRAGTDCTVVATGAMVGKAIEAATALVAEGVEVEVVDPRTLVPLDRETILDSVARTRHLVIAHEGCRTGGVGAEIAALVAQEGFWSLDGPIVRVASPDIPVPFSAILEGYYIPTTSQVVEGIRATLGVA